MTIEYQELMNEYANNTSDYSADKSLGLMKIRRLDRIADAMERIADSLEALTECIGYMPPQPYQIEGFHFIRIGGSVDTE